MGMELTTPRLRHELEMLKVLTLAPTSFTESDNYMFYYFGMHSQEQHDACRVMCGKEIVEGNKFASLCHMDGTFQWKSAAWVQILNAMKAFGWEPQGTILNGNKHNYTTNSAQRVIWEDAQGMLEATNNMIRKIENMQSFDVSAQSGENIFEPIPKLRLISGGEENNLAEIKSELNHVIAEFYDSMMDNVFAEDAELLTLEEWSNYIKYLIDWRDYLNYVVVNKTYFEIR